MSSNDNGCEKAPTKLQSFGLDDVLLKIGEFGRFQQRCFVPIILMIIFHGVSKYGFIFSAGTVFYRCRIPECDGSEQSSYEQPWTEFSIPKTASGQLEKCHRYQTFNSTIGPDSCFSGNFDKTKEVGCDGDLIFRDQSVTISNEFEIFCSDEWKLAMVGTMNNLGQFLGIPFCGYLSDKLGRSRILAYSSVMAAIVGIIRSFSPNYYVFALFGFLDNLCSSTIYGTSFLLVIEILGPSIRVHASTLIPLFSACGRFLLAFVAKNVSSWRSIERILYIPALGFITLPWILPESVRWLLSQGEEVKATEILQKIAKINKRKLSDPTLAKLLQANRKLIDGVETKDKKRLIGQALKLLPWRILTLAFCWFVNVFVFVGLSLNTSLVGPNKYNSFMYLSLIEIPGTLLQSLTINRYGRKLSLFGQLFLTGLFITSRIFVSSGNLQLILILCGKMTITASFQILYVFTLEIFPTSVRNSLWSVCSMIGRLGSMVAPQTPLMAKYYESAPAILFASTAFLSSFLILLIPETKNTVLPTTLAEAKNLAQKEIEVQLEPEVEETLLKSTKSSSA